MGLKKLSSVTAMLNQQDRGKTASVQRLREAVSISILIFLSIFMPIKHVELETLLELRQQEEDGERVIDGTELRGRE